MFQWWVWYGLIEVEFAPLQTEYKKQWLATNCTVTSDDICTYNYRTYKVERMQLTLLNSMRITVDTSTWWWKLRRRHWCLALRSCKMSNEQKENTENTHLYCIPYCIPYVFLSDAWGVSVCHVDAQCYWFHFDLHNADAKYCGMIYVYICHDASLSINLIYSL